MDDYFSYDLLTVKARLEQLDNVISYLFEEIPFNVNGETKMVKRSILTPGEKICVNQERASLREFKAYLFREIEHKDVRFYRIPSAIDAKVQDILKTIANTNWTKKEET